MSALMFPPTGAFSTTPHRQGPRRNDLLAPSSPSWTISGTGAEVVRHPDVTGSRHGVVSVPLKLLLLGAVVALACVFPSLAAAPEDAAREIREALRKNDVAALEALWNRPGIATLRDAQGDTALIMAAQVGSPASVTAAIRAGIEVNATNHTGATALLRGAGNPDVVRRLLEAGARPDVASAIGHTPLMLAARSPGGTESVRLLLAHGANVHAKSRYGATALMAAVAAANGEVVGLLLDRGADVNAVPMPEAPGVDPIWGGLRTPLMWAAYRGDANLAGRLIDRGADVNQVIPFGTAASHAAWRGDADMARLLVERGASVRTADPFSGFTPLHWAASVESDDARLVQFLMSRGADPLAEGGQPVDAFLGEPQTPVALARLRGDTGIARALNRGVGAPGGRREVPATVESAPVDRMRVASAVASAIPALQRTAEVSRESFLRHASKQDCVSCHQQYFPLAAVSEGKRRGVAVDEGAAKALVETILKNHRGTSFDAEPMFHPDAPHDYGYAMLALRIAGVRAGGETDALVHHLAAVQAADGRWSVNLPRPPMQSSDVAATALAVHALVHYAWPARAEEFAARVRRASAWLAAAKPATHEERVYALLGLHWSGVPRAELEARAATVIGEQRPDGGWSQLPDLDSDAYATGQALFALREVFGDGGYRPAMERATRFLVTSQARDGTWHVRRRAFPFQPTMESGFPYGRDSWISATGTSWAVMALAAGLEALTPTESRTLAARIEAGRRPSEGPTTSGTARPQVPSAVGNPVSFAQDIRPVLERSCLPCHSGDRARGNYRLNDRVSMLTPGNAGVRPVVPGRAEESLLLKYVSDEIPEFSMPPQAKRGQYPALGPTERARLRDWVESGAVWPEGVVLGVSRTASAEATR